MMTSLSVIEAGLVSRGKALGLSLLVHDGFVALCSCIHWPIHLRVATPSTYLWDSVKRTPHYITLGKSPSLLPVGAKPPASCTPHCGLWGTLWGSLETWVMELSWFHLPAAELSTWVASVNRSLGLSMATLP